MIIVKTSVWQYLGILFQVAHKFLKMSVETSKNNGKNSSKNIVKLNYEQNINLCCIIIWSAYVQSKPIFDNFMISLPYKIENLF